LTKAGFGVQDHKVVKVDVKAKRIKLTGNAAFSNSRHENPDEPAFSLLFSEFFLKDRINMPQDDSSKLKLISISSCLTFRTGENSLILETKLIKGINIVRFQ